MVRNGFVTDTKGRKRGCRPSKRKLPHSNVILSTISFLSKNKKVQNLNQIAQFVEKALECSKNEKKKQKRTGVPVSEIISSIRWRSKIQSAVSRSFENRLSTTPKIPSFYNNSLSSHEIICIYVSEKQKTFLPAD